MRIDRRDFNRNLTQSQVDREINNLLIGISEFSEIACMDGKMFGVITFCDSCDIEINSCVRNHLLEQLHAAQLVTEKHLGYALTPRFVEKEFLWNGEPLVLLEPGIEAVNVQESVTEYGTFDIFPYIEFDSTVVVDSGYFMDISAALVKNPNEIFFRNAEDDSLIRKTQGLTGYPKKISGNWRIPVEAIPNVEVNTQHCKLMFCDIPEQDEGDPIPLPCYPDSNQIIPIVKDPEAIEGGLRYWFYVWNLVDDAFGDDEIDLEQGQFYKLLSEITFKQFSSSESLPVVTVWSRNDDCEVVFEAGEEDLLVSIKDAQKGIIFLEYGPKCCTPIAYCRDQKIPFKVRVKYKVNPEYLEFQINYAYAEQAISNLAAAELPLHVCNCPVSKGFIHHAQTKHDEIRINPVTGDVIATPRNPVENLYGKIIWGATINKMEKIGRYVKS